MTCTVHLGGSVGFYSGNVQELLDDVLVSWTGTDIRAWVTVTCLERHGLHTLAG